MNKFSYKRLGDISEVLLSSVDKKMNENETVVNLCNFVDVYYNWAITNNSSKSFMKASVTNKEFKDFLLKKGYVAITKDSETRDDIGISTYIAENLDNTCLGYHCALIKPNEKEVCGKYLNALLSTRYARKIFSFQASGSGQRYTLAKESIENIKIPLPSLLEQKKIGNFFSFIDRKIELNNQIIDNLSKLVKELYDYWFVQFDFPNEKNLPYKTNGGALKWSKELKREVPEKWTVIPIFKASDIQYGCPLSTEKFGEEGIPVVRIRDISENSYSALTKESVDDKYLTQSGDLLIGMDGNFQMNFWHSSGFIVNQRITRVRKTILPLMVLKEQIEPIINAKVTNVARSTVGHLGDNDIKSLYVLLPDNSLDLSVFDYCLKQICNKTREIHNLIKIRNWLLPLLIYRQVKIDN